jgi:predicted nucleic acid-binding protein
VRGRWLRAFLARHQTIALDTSPFIYHLQDHPTYRVATAAIFQAIERGHPAAVTSTVTMLELLVKPFKDQNIELVNSIFSLASRYPNLSWVEPSLAVAERGAQLRARYSLRTPDAIQAATAIVSHATGLITNDAALGRVDELDVLLLDTIRAS